MEDKRSVGRAIISAIAGGLIFGVAFFVIRVLAALLINLLSEVPLLGWLIDRFLKLRGESPDMFCCVVAAVVGFFLSLQVMVKVSKSNSTLSLSAKLVGICMIVIHLLSLVLNLTYGEPIFPNIIQTIAGIGYIYLTKE